MSTNTILPRILFLAVGAIALVSPVWCEWEAQGQTSGAAVNPGAAIVQEFQKRVADFVKLHKQIEGQLTPLKPTAVAKEITDHQRELARRIIEMRKTARQGDVFTPEIISELQRLIGITMRGTNGADIRLSLAHAEPVRIEVGINSSYPASVPLQSTPPTLLLNLPKLPPEVDYRIVGNALVLRDVIANVIVDFMPGAIPESRAR